jgi:hypothetical protein
VVRTEPAAGRFNYTRRCARFADVDKALTDFYEDTIKKVGVQTGVSEVVLREWFENELITEAKTRNMVYRGEETTGNLPTPAAEAALASFILREEVRPGGIWYELVHDRLVEPILKANQTWRLKQPLPRLARRWQDADRAQNELLHEQDLKRLTAVPDWQLLGPLVTEFVAASETAVRTKQERARQETLKHHRKLAEAERQRAEAEQQKAKIEQQRADEAEKAKQKRGIWIALASAIAIVAVILAMTANSYAKKAETEASLANIKTLQVEAQSNRATRSETAAKNAAEDAKLAAENARAAAADARRSESLAEARRLAYSAEQFLAEGNIIGSLIIGREIYNRTQITVSSATAATIQDIYGALWLTLNAAANNNISGAESFRRPVISPTGLIITRTIMAGPEASTLSTWQEDKLISWEVDGNTVITYTYELPFNITHAALNDDHTAMVVVAESAVPAVHLLQRVGNTFKRSGNPLREKNLNITSLAINQDGTRVAIAFCVQEEDKSCSIHIKGSDGLAREADFEIFTQDKPVTDMVFADIEGTILVWNSGQNIHLEALEGSQEWQAPPREDNRYYTALTTVANSDWLIIASCEIQSSSDQSENPCNEGQSFIRWWHLGQGSWLPAARTATTIERLIYSPERQTFFSQSATGQIDEWSTDFTKWPDIACQVAGRNLNASEWAEAFPAVGNAWQEDFSHSRRLTTACHEFGLDLSFATKALITCDQNSRHIAHYLYGRSERPSISGRLVLPFNSWAPLKLVGTAMTFPERARECLSIASEIDETIPDEVILSIIEQLKALQKQDKRDKIVRNIDFIQAIDAVAEQRRQATLPPSIAAAVDLNLLALYGEACAMRLTIPDQNPACLTFDQMQLQVLNYNAAHVVPLFGQVGQWLFYSQGKQFINIGYSGPSLLLNNMERRYLTQSTNPAAPNQAGQISYRLPESGVYSLEVDPFATSLEAPPPVISAYEPPELPFNKLLTDLQQEVWRVTVEPGTTIVISVTSAHTSDLFDLELLLRNEQWQTIPLPWLNEYGTPSQQFTLPDAGDYYVSLNWHYGDPGRHSVSFSLIEPVEPKELVPGNQLLANAADRYWYFTGLSTSPMQLELHAEGANGLPRLLLYDEQGDLLTANNNDNGESDIRLDVLLANADFYRAEVDWWGTADPYTITLTFIEPQLITLGSEIEADPSQRWWQFEGRAEEVVEIGVEAFESLEMETLSYPSLWVYDAGGVLIAWDDNWWNEPNALVQVLLPESGRYTIQINWAAEPTHYQLALNLVEIDEQDHIDEQDDSGIAAEAEMIQYGQIRQGSPEQRRWQFEANPGDFISIAMDSVGHDPYLRLFDAKGEQVAFDDDGGVGLNALIQFLILEGGLYEIDAGWFGSSSPGPYTLTLDRVETGSLQIGQTITANTQERIWQFAGQEGQIVSIHPEAIEATTPYVTVLDAQGNQLLTIIMMSKMRSGMSGCQLMESTILLRTGTIRLDCTG